MAEDESKAQVMEIYDKFLGTREELMKAGKLPKFDTKFIDSLNKKQHEHLSNIMLEFLTSKMREEFELVEFTLKFIEESINE